MLYQNDVDDAVGASAVYRFGLEFAQFAGGIAYLSEVMESARKMIAQLAEQIKGNWVWPIWVDVPYQCRLKLTPVPVCVRVCYYRKMPFSKSGWVYRRKR